MAFWGIEVKPTKSFTHSLGQACGRLRISQATLGFGSANEKSVVQCNIGKKSPVLLCSLLPEKAESCHLELEFEEAEEVTFSVVGPRSVHLTGYYVGNVRRSVDNDDSESFGEDIEDTESEYSKDEDEYEDSFIDDDIEGSPPSSSPDGEASEDKTKKKKSDNRKRGCKRLKKKYELSESEDSDFIIRKNNACHPDHYQIVESDYDQIPISSLRGSLESVPDDSKRKMHKLAECTNDENQSEERKVKKKKKRKTNKENAVNLEEDGTKFMMEPRETETGKRTTTFSDGLVVEELEIGADDGKIASKGKKVTVHYTGTLKKGGKVFDSTAGKHPLKFRIGEDVALDGLDRGVEGMRVGGKRRLIIPPALGYGSEGTERVPPNSWLIMDVEVLRVRR